MFTQNLQRIGFACKYLHPDQTQKKKVLEEIAKETGSTIEIDYPMQYKGKSGRKYPSKRPVTKLIFNKDFKGKAIAQYKKGGIFEKFRKVS